jgi:hypothetical protein
MSEGKIRGKILVELWSSGKPMTLQIISDKIGLNSASAMGYLLGLIKANYVCVPQKHYYAITVSGKQAIGLPKIDKSLAQKLLSPVPMEEAFHFYYDIDQPTGVYATSLKDLADKIQNVDIKSIEFHLPRRDFELWILSLEDLELSKKLGMLRAAKMSGENLRNSLYAIINSRYEELKSIAE